MIAFGGGSALDAGKAISLMAGQTRPIWDFDDVGDNWLRVDVSVMAPLVAVPTTAGTGSETGRASAIIDEESHIKKIIFHPRMMPGVVVSNPTLTVGLPARITTATGMDALVHCFEAYCAPGFHPMADGIALEGMQLIKDWLPVAFEDGGNLTARSNMLAAASMGSTAFQKGLCAVHAMSHPVGAVYDMHHGLTNAVFLPYVISFNRSAIEDKAIRLAHYLDLQDRSFSGLIDWVLELRRALNIPDTARDLGVPDDLLDTLAKMAADDAAASGNPVPIVAADMLRLYEAAMLAFFCEATSYIERVFALPRADGGGVALPFIEFKLDVGRNQLVTQPVTDSFAFIEQTDGVEHIER